MPEISILEFGVYGFVAYSSLLMLIISTIKDVPTSRSLSIIRAMYLIPGIICCILLAGSGLDINAESPATVFTNRTTFNYTNNLIFTELTNQTVVTPAHYTLENPVWVALHYFFAIIMAVYVILQMVTLFTKSD